MSIQDLIAPDDIDVSAEQRQTSPRGAGGLLPSIRPPRLERGDHEPLSGFRDIRGGRSDDRNLLAIRDAKTIALADYAKAAGLVVITRRNSFHGAGAKRLVKATGGAPRARGGQSCGIAIGWAGTAEATGPGPGAVAL